MTMTVPGRSCLGRRRSYSQSLTAAVLAVALLMAAPALITPAGAASPNQSAITASNAATSGRNNAEDAATPPGTADDELAPLTDGEIAGYGCLASGAAATALMWAAGTNQMIMVVAGGTLGPTNLAGVIVAVTGTVFASVCAVGALATPAVLRMWDIYYRGKHVKAAETAVAAGP